MSNSSGWPYEDNTTEPVAELNFTNFISSLIAKAIAREKTQ